MAPHAEAAAAPVAPGRRHYPKGSTLSREGEVDFGWFVLQSGRIGVFKGGAEIEVFDEPGVVFGELSGILQRPRTASLVALDDADVLYLTADLDDLITHHPTVTRKLLVMLAERLAETTEAFSVCVHDAPRG
ncbi:MAG: cyclic nucleotide-binding domain-containing protein [Vicinamibacterales bacterium]|nr:cyclic nucleotide-binding domain-containing protein [Vicinamibacterales bacterium]